MGLFKDSPSPPPTPDPYAVAAATADANVETALASRVLQNIDQVTTTATKRYVQQKDENDNLIFFNLQEVYYELDVDGQRQPAGTVDRQIPVWESVTALNTKEQVLFNQQQEIRGAVNDVAVTQISFLKTKLETQFTLTGLPAHADALTAPSLNDTITDVGEVRRTVGTEDFRHERKEVIDVINNRLQWQIQRDRKALTARLANEGIFASMEAHQEAMRSFDLRADEAHGQAIAAGGAEQNRLFEMENARARFEIASQGERFRQAMLRLNIHNATEIQRFQTFHSIALFVESVRERGLQETLVERSTVLNEISALQSNGQVSIPRFSPYNAPSVAPVPIGDYIYKSAAMDMDKFQIKREDQAAKIGAIASLAGTATKAALGVPPV